MAEASQLQHNLMTEREQCNDICFYNVIICLKCIAIGWVCACIVNHFSHKVVDSTSTIDVVKLSSGC